MMRGSSPRCALFGSPGHHSERLQRETKCNKNAIPVCSAELFSKYDVSLICSLS